MITVIVVHPVFGIERIQVRNETRIAHLAQAYPDHIYMVVS